MIDPVRVGIVEEAIDDLAAIGRTRAHAWAVAIINALDAHDRDAHVHDQRGQLEWRDELDAEDGSDD